MRFNSALLLFTLAGAVAASAAPAEQADAPVARDLDGADLAERAGGGGYYGCPGDRRCKGKCMKMGETCCDNLKGAKCPAGRRCERTRDGNYFHCVR